VFCEKPMATSAADADRVVRAVRRSGVAYAIDYVLRPNPLNRAMKELVALGIVGPLLHWSLENHATDEPLKPDHWFWDESESGGVWVEHGVHFFDMARWVTSQPVVDIVATGAMSHPPHRDRVAAIARHSGGVLATHYHGFTQPQRFEETTVRLTFARGYVTMWGWIPLRCRVEALVDDDELRTLGEWAGVEPRVVERYSGAHTTGWSHGGTYRVTARATVEINLDEDKYVVYGRAVRDNMVDLIDSAGEPHRVPAITLDDAHDSLTDALAARAASSSDEAASVP
jgi:predicted dehydrogenase